MQIILIQQPSAIVQYFAVYYAIYNSLNIIIFKYFVKKESQIGVVVHR
jgi:hypothetical protein